MQKTNISAQLFIVNGLLPEGSRLVCDKAVTDDNHPIGAALIQFTATGTYSMLNAGVVSSCDQKAAAAIDSPDHRIAWDKKHTTQVMLKLNNNTDADILRWLAVQPNKQGAIKEMIRARIAQENK